MEIQSEIEELVKAKQDQAIVEKIASFTLCTKEEVLMRKRAGLYGISVITVALYQKGASKYLEDLVRPVIEALSDREIKVQQAACDALFNIIKIVRETILDR